MLKEIFEETLSISEANDGIKIIFDKDAPQKGTIKIGKSEYRFYFNMYGSGYYKGIGLNSHPFSSIIIFNKNKDQKLYEFKNIEDLEKSGVVALNHRNKNDVAGGGFPVLFSKAANYFEGGYTIRNMGSLKNVEELTKLGRQIGLKDAQKIMLNYLKEKIKEILKTFKVAIFVGADENKKQTAIEIANQLGGKANTKCNFVIEFDALILGDKNTIKNNLSEFNCYEIIEEN